MHNNEQPIHKCMLINVREKGEVRVAVVENGTLEELYVERESLGQLVGNIYKAKVVNIEPSIQAAFVDFGGERNGFLHVSDVQPSLYAEKEHARQQGGEHRHLPIQAALKRGQELIVQVNKEAVRNKAPGVTTYISLPGRYLVLMPGFPRRGVSRKISDEQERARLKELLSQLHPPSDMGIIVRTAGIDKSKRDLERDMHYLQRLWEDVCQRAKKAEAPQLLYQESDLVIRAIRDLFTADIAEMWVDSEEEYKKILSFMHATMPRYRKVVKLYTDAEPLFHRFDIESQIAKINQKRVPLPGGAYLVIEQTEALVAIDVNSGRFKKGSTPEETAFQINLAAAKEIARQIRLRDLGGVIVNDFIDMTDEDHKREVERALWEAVRRDRARTRMLRMSRFGIIEMTRQRVRHSLQRSQYEECPTCKGTGQVKNIESVILDTFRRIRYAANQEDVVRIEVCATPEILLRLENEHRAAFAAIEKEEKKAIVLSPDPKMGVENTAVKCYKKEGSPQIV